MKIILTTSLNTIYLVTSMNDITLYNATTAQQIYDLVTAGFSVNDCYLEEDEHPYYATTPLHSACNQGNLEVVRAICESGLDDVFLNLKLYTGTPIMVASRKDNLEIVKYLVSIGANINGVLTTISNFGYEDILDYILTLKPDLNEKYRGSASLHEACLAGHINFIEKLLINGANPNIKDNTYDESPLMSLMRMRSISMDNMLHISKLLIVYGADYYYINAQGSVLHYLTTYMRYASPRQINDRIETLKFLVGIGCDINLQNFKGKTPLQYLTCQSSEVIEEYIKLGANIY